MPMPMRKKSPDVLEALMSEPLDEEEMPEEADSDTAVMSFEDDEPEAAPEEGTPEAKIGEARKILDELEMMFSQE